MLDFTFGFFSQYGPWAECQLSTDQPELWGGALILMKSLFEYKWYSTEPVKSRTELQIQVSTIFSIYISSKYFTEDLAVDLTS